MQNFNEGENTEKVDVKQEAVSEFFFFFGDF